jgi:cytochrome c-type biogenesis protein CcmH
MSVARHCGPVDAAAASGERPSAAREARYRVAVWRSGPGRLGACALLLGLVFALAAPFAHAIDPLPFKDRAEEVRFQHLTRQLRCLVCQNQDLADSDAELAGELRKQIFDMMRSGKTDAEIKQYLVARYNDFVLYDPPLKPGTWILWFTPFVLVAIGAFVVARILRRRAAQAAAKPQTDIEAGDDW